ncbi:MAG: redox-sensing transcriptional repressor Rex [Candidatus Wallbacteria bacterium HGW-Wallbacteria-1]|jgi:redox-sensing transcriptional repressor|uniref:Redox-sensing transcriptional repressor Rex n=1 Tax=Candidatus Wallbacteria bacterium HGW-Wallbacteria-1 TaxID=2013854 RepID=A0A2N1PUY9_9BACT|nr:MAG: redox-sensing transcriptional repressor Rex [Candidatus Wallbacteria bacterium HGW-Wallbacteria-1]
MMNEKGRMREVDPRSIPDSTVTRLSRYLRVLEEMHDIGGEVVSSAEIARATSCNPAQVRKDLSYFGEFGNRGKGYRAIDLRKAIEGILGLDKECPMALVGVGHLGKALLNYRGFARKGFVIRAAFDVNPSVQGSVLDGVVVESLSAMRSRIREIGIQTAMLAVPVQAAQDISDILVEAGIRGILCFAPSHLRVPAGVWVRYADLTTELEALSFYLAHSDKNL